MVELCEKTVKLLNDSKTDKNVALKLVGVDDNAGKELKPLQVALKLYPNLVNDVAVKKMIQENISQAYAPNYLTRSYSHIL